MTKLGIDIETHVSTALSKNGMHTIQSYNIIYSDPPWKQKKGGLRKCRPNQVRSLDYPVLGIEEIFALHKPFFEQAAERHNVFMWTIDKYLIVAQEQMEELGYKLHARLIWDKTNGVAPAFTVRFTHEYLLWFYRTGRMLMPCKESRGKFPTVLREPGTYHSHKPVAAYEMLEAMFPGARKLELFARGHRDGWDCWGNEVESEP